MDITGIILCGGKSSRMGKDKGLLEFKGKCLVEYSIELAKQFCSRIILSANSVDYEQFGYEIVKDKREGTGPLEGIISGLKISETDINLVLGCDNPFINNKLIDFLIFNYKNESCLIPEHYGLLEPLIGIYNKQILPEIIHLANKKVFKMIKVIEHVNGKRISVKDQPFYFNELFSNINTENDLKALNKVII